MDYEERSIPKCFLTVEILAMKPVWRFSDQGSFIRVYVFWMINDQVGHDGGPSDEVVAHEPRGPFVKYEDAWKEQEEDKSNIYYESLVNGFGSACACSELICQPPHRVDEIKPICTIVLRLRFADC